LIARIRFASDYGQPHRIGFGARQRCWPDCAEFPSWRERLDQDHLIDLRVLGEISETASLGTWDITLAKSGLPNTFVPGRNILFSHSRGGSGLRA
jgi:7-cyano-7-deazaguanine synthase